MAALPFMQLYVAEYLADTAYLSTEENGAYLLLIFNYWQRGKPLPADPERLRRIARMSSDRWTDVEQTLSEYFNVTPTEWQHDRLDADLEAVQAKSDQAIMAGKASGEARKRAARTVGKAMVRNER